MMNNDKTYIAIVVAAGLSSRMGGFKPLMALGGKPALFRLLDTIQDAGIERICVVTGHERAALENALAGCKTRGAAKIDSVYNADYENGMFSSVQAGVRRASEAGGGFADAADAALLFPADAPLLRADTIRGLIAAWEARADEARPPFAVPVCDGKNGHPLLIPRYYYNEILTYEGGGGLKGVRAKYDADMVKYETNDAGCILDMDTPEDYARLLDYEKRNR